MAVVSMKALLETGVHFGHRTRKWNPRMKPYIFTERNGIHIVDLQQTLEALEEGYALVRDTVANGGAVLFVGTKRQAQDAIETEARRAGMSYVNARWLGGTLTNWRTIRSRIDELKELERRRDEGELDLLTKKEALTITRKIERLEERLGGIREMRGLPKLLFVVDVRREETAIHEANLLNIPVAALVDTNCDPSGIDYVIPSNDDAIRAIKLLTSKIADAALEGLALRKDMAEEEVELPVGAPVHELEDLEVTDEDLLGEATLAKLKSGAYDEREAALEAEGTEEAKAEGEEVEQGEVEKPELDEETVEAADEVGIEIEQEGAAEQAALEVGEASEADKEPEEEKAGAEASE